jgi:hypothetical protein
LEGKKERSILLVATFCKGVEGGEKVMQDPILLNGKPRATLIQRFNGSVLVVGPKAKETLNFSCLDEAEEEVERRGWVISITHPTLREEV